MTWEYFVLSSDQAESTQFVQSTLDEFGRAGWELVETSKKFFIFKRPIPSVPIDLATETAVEDDE